MPVGEKIDPNDTDLLTDLISAVRQQREKDGHHRTPLGSAEDLKTELTSKWRGSLLVARLIPDSPTHIIKHGVDKRIDPAENNYEPVQFDYAFGIVDEVSPAFGGYIELRDGTCIALPHRQESEGPIPADYDPGLRILSI